MSSEPSAGKEVLELAQTPDGCEVIEALVADALDEVKVTPAAYLEQPEPWEAVDEEFRDYEEQLAAKVRPRHCCDGW
jgi:hypothetical protein